MKHLTLKPSILTEDMIGVIGNLNAPFITTFSINLNRSSIELWFSYFNFNDPDPSNWSMRDVYRGLHDLYDLGLKNREIITFVEYENVGFTDLGLKQDAVVAIWITKKNWETEGGKIGRIRIDPAKSREGELEIFEISPLPTLK